MTSAYDRETAHSYGLSSAPVPHVKVTREGRLGGALGSLIGTLMVSLTGYWATKCINYHLRLVAKCVRLDHTRRSHRADIALAHAPNDESGILLLFFGKQRRLTFRFDAFLLALLQLLDA